MIDALLTTALLSLSAGISAAAPPLASGAEERLAAFCARDSSAVDRALGDRATLADLRAVGGDFDPLARYEACRSLHGAADVCSPLKGLRDGLEASCREIADHARVVRRILSTGEGQRACVESLATSGKSGPAVDRACAALVAGAKAGDARPSCPAAKQAGLFGPKDVCEEDLLFWKGDPEACASIKTPGRRTSCQEEAALVAGLRDPARCAQSPACLSFQSKKPAACDRYREEYFKAVCGGITKTLETRRATQAENLRRFEELRKRQEALAAYDAKVKAEAQTRARRKAEADAIQKASQRQFKKGMPKVNTDEEVQENIRRLEQGLPPLTPQERAARRKQKGKPAPAAEPAP